MGKFTQKIPLISIVVPSYNHKKYIGLTIESICTQSYKRIQLIVVDDGSTDGSVEYIDELKNSYKSFIEEFIYVTQPNSGLTKTLNYALYRHVSGEYVAFVASDDYLLDDSLKLRYECLKNTSSDVVFSEMTRVDEEGLFLDNISFTKERYVSLADLSVRSNFLPAPSSFFKTSALKNVGGFDETLWFEDLDMWFRLLKSNYKLFLFKKNLVCYRDVKGSMSKKLDNIYKCACETMDRHSDVAGMKYRRAWVFLSYYRSGGYKFRRNHFNAVKSLLRLLSPHFLYLRLKTSGR